MGNEVDKTDDPGSILDIQVDYDGMCHIFCGRAGEAYNADLQIYIFLDLIAGLTTQFVEFNNILYQKLGYYGKVDFGIGLTGVAGSVFHTDRRIYGMEKKPFDANIYKKTGRFSAIEISKDPKIISQYLTMPFINALSQNHVNPFS